MTHRKDIIGIVIAIMILTIIDAICTSIGISIGAITEGNPIFCDMMSNCTINAAILAIIYTAILLIVIIHYADFCKCAIYLLSLICIIKILIVVMHIEWIATL